MMFFIYGLDMVRSLCSSKVSKTSKISRMLLFSASLPQWLDGSIVVSRNLPAFPIVYSPRSKQQRCEPGDHSILISSHPNSQHIFSSSIQFSALPSIRLSISPLPPTTPHARFCAFDDDDGEHPPPLPEMQSLRLKAVRSLALLGGITGYVVRLNSGPILELFRFTSLQLRSLQNVLGVHSCIVPWTTCLSTGLETLVGS
ncbi:hypothetical protein BKA64DRAFT_307463 [Cadophora sp. MPI-SDFR-AT-0126]|nr:hypothetical protein BKA64DRAFT_307463 [Leotiomycetes sp. MPI-SDFR-AT-0126]